MNSMDPSLSRRDFVAALAATLMATWLAPATLRAASQTMLRKAVPGSTTTLPVIGLGSSRTFDVGSDTAAMAPLVEVVQEFFARGGELIDSSPMYGSAEQVIGALLKSVGASRQQLFAATKVWTDGKQAGIRQMETSTQQWAVDQFDLLQIHNLRDWQTHLQTLKVWKAEGKVRFIGITTSHGRDHRELEALLRSEPFDFVQLSYNIGNRTVEERLLPLAADRGMAVLINRPYQRGALFRKVKNKTLPDWAGDFDCASWGQFFLKYIVSHPAVTCAIPATTKVHHLRDNMAAGYGQLPDAAMRKRMQDYFAAL